VSFTGDGTLLAAALVFAVAAGLNDGSTLLSVGSRVPRLQLIWAVVIAAAALVATPLLLGTSVAATFLSGLVALDAAPEGAMLFAVLTALAVVALLGSRGIPTSLTVATIGGLVGTGLGRGLEVHWGRVSAVIGVALIAPIAGALAAYAVVSLAGRVGARRGAGRLLRSLHVGAFGLQSVAYGANDGQKMLAAYAAAGGSGALGGLTLLDLTVIALLFAFGAVIGLRRYARTLGLKVLPVRPLNAVAAEVSAAGVATGAGLLGSPVSSTQSLVAALVGSGLREGHLRVRWRTVSAIGLAWLTTFPLAVGLGAAAGGATRMLA